ncbi:alpha/beta hydrolase [Undibacterium sp. Di27W]|uniref:alpha/beta hydrolase n=1 Tax=Undibacterium sp. Di27W TaxID=3413036 RepID=UPI003BF35585
MKKRFLALLLSALCTLSLAAETTSTPLTPLTIGSSLSLHSQALGEERTINIILPEGYTTETASKYPVIYLLDGAVDEDLIHMAGAVQFSSFSWVNRLPASILVGIANTDRRRDMTFKAADNFSLPASMKTYSAAFKNAGGSAKFMEFLEKELQPYIEKNYRSNGDKTLVGQSLAGLLATEVLLKKPALFNNYIIMSPSLWWDNESLLKQAPALLKNLPSQPMKVYLAVGKEGSQMEGDARALSRAITQSKAKNLSYHFEFLPGEDHGSILHGAAMHAFQLFYEKKK